MRKSSGEPHDSKIIVGSEEKHNLVQDERGKMLTPIGYVPKSPLGASVKRLRDIFETPQQSSTPSRNAAPKRKLYSDWNRSSIESAKSSEKEFIDESTPVRKSAKISEEATPLNASSSDTSRQHSTSPSEHPRSQSPKKLLRLREIIAKYTAARLWETVPPNQCRTTLEGKSAFQTNETELESLLKILSIRTSKETSPSSSGTTTPSVSALKRRFLGEQESGTKRQLLTSEVHKVNLHSSSFDETASKSNIKFKDSTKSRSFSEYSTAAASSLGVNLQTSGELQFLDTRRPCVEQPTMKPHKTATQLDSGSESSQRKSIGACSIRPQRSPRQRIPTGPNELRILMEKIGHARKEFASQMLSSESSVDLTTANPAKISGNITTSEKCVKQPGKESPGVPQEMSGNRRRLSLPPREDHGIQLHRRSKPSVLISERIASLQSHFLESSVPSPSRSAVNRPTSVDRKSVLLGRITSEKDKVADRRQKKTSVHSETERVQKPEDISSERRLDQKLITRKFSPGSQQSTSKEKSSSSGGIPSHPAEFIESRTPMESKETAFQHAKVCGLVETEDLGMSTESSLGMSSQLDKSTPERCFARSGHENLETVSVESTLPNASQLSKDFCERQETFMSSDTDVQAHSTIMEKSEIEIDEHITHEYRIKCAVSSPGTHSSDGSYLPTFPAVSPIVGDHIKLEFEVSVPECISQIDFRSIQIPRPPENSPEVSELVPSPEPSGTGMKNTKQGTVARLRRLFTGLDDAPRSPDGIRSEDRSLPNTVLTTDESVQYPIYIAGSMEVTHDNDLQEENAICQQQQDSDVVDAEEQSFMETD